jgi:hypothetical protein
MRYVLFALLLSGCTQDFDAFLGDASTGDATSTDSATDAAKDVAQQDTGPVDAGPLTFGCGTQTMSDCSQCNGFPQPCVYCGANSALAGRCVQQGTSCTFGAPAGFQVCGCANASACPESYQVCRNGACRTCTDSVNNVGQSCKGGGTCAPDAGCN